MKFKQLDFDAFKKESLTDNMLRSINGGEITTGTCENPTDCVDGSGCTSYDNGDPGKCDVKQRHDNHEGF